MQQHQRHLVPTSLGLGGGLLLDLVNAPPLSSLPGVQDVQQVCADVLGS